MLKLIKSLLTSILLFFYCLNIFAQPAVQTTGITVGLLYSANCNVAEGYTLFSPQNSANTYLIDNCGYIINQWTFSGGTNFTGTYLTTNGDVIKIVANGNGVATYGSGCIEKRDWNDNLLWEYCGTGNNIGIHSDLYELPNGNIVALVQRQYTATQAVQKGISPNNFGNFYKTEAVIEVQQTGPTTGNVVWEWDLWDHIVQNNNSNITSNYVTDFSTVPGKFDGDLIDGFSHFNSINYMSDRDHFLLSNWRNDEIYIIDHNTTTTQAAGTQGDFLWRWGNPENYDAGTLTDKRLDGQHNPKLIPSSYAVHGGKISVFNNGFSSLSVGTSSGSAACVINPTYNATTNTYASNSATSAFLPTDYDYFWAGDIFAGDDMFSSIMSGVDAQANGNLMITEATIGRISEVTPGGEVVWVYQTPEGSSSIQNQGGNPFGDIYKIDKYAPNYPGILSTTSTNNLVENNNAVSVNCSAGSAANFDIEITNFQNNIFVSTNYTCISSTDSTNLIASYDLVNNGITTITDVSYEYLINGNLIGTFTLALNIMECERTTINLPTVQIADLNNTIEINLLSINTTSTDDVASNNSITESVQLSNNAGNFVDSGGATGNYGSNENETYLICPTNSFLETIEITFTAVDIEVNTNGNGSQDGCWDYLTIYNGNSTSSPVLAQTLCGEDNGQVPNDINSLLNVGDVFTSTDASGCLTVGFNSDSSVSGNGWEATINCLSNGISCPTNLNLTGNIITGTYNADDYLTSNGVVNIASAGTVNYYAGDDYIELQDNFDCTGEVDFNAEIIDCDPSN